MDSPAIGTEGDDDLAPRRQRPPRPADGAGGPTTEQAGTTSAERLRPQKKDRDLPGAADLQRHAAKAVSRSRGPRLRARSPLGARAQPVEDPAVVLNRLVGPERAKSLHRILRNADTAFRAERFGDARAQLRPVVGGAPDLPDGRELMGLSLYRMGKWREAIDQLEAFRALSHSTEQHPVLMDCHRALGRWNDVEALWEELGDASPVGGLVTEGRIVLAGAQADQGDLAKAIRTLETGWKSPRRPRDHNLRRAYALADLYDRAGKTIRSRNLFKWIAGHDPRFADVRSRVKALS